VSGLTVLVLIVASVYAAACLFWPLAACWRCKGVGRLSPTWDSRHARICPACKGEKWRTRWGVRVMRALFGHRDRR